jgi:hypothetical protein
LKQAKRSKEKRDSANRGDILFEFPSCVREPELMRIRQKGFEEKRDLTVILRKPRAPMLTHRCSDIDRHSEYAKAESFLVH